MTDKYVEVLRKIAEQKLPSEMDDGGEGADYEYAYEAIVNLARYILKDDSKNESRKDI